MEYILARVIFFIFHNLAVEVFIGLFLKSSLDSCANYRAFSKDFTCIIYICRWFIDRMTGFY